MVIAKCARADDIVRTVETKRVERWYLIGDSVMACAWIATIAFARTPLLR